MKILLSGSSGLLGSALTVVAKRLGHECDALSRPQALSPDANVGVFIEKMSGYDCVIHAAANTNVERCEENPDECYRDNLLLTEAIADAADAANVKLIFISSTGIYGTAQTRPYREYDEVEPTTHHHRSKYLAEKKVLNAATKNMVIRTGWLFGGSDKNPKNFVARRIDEARAAVQGNNYIESNADQRGVPCFNEDIAERILELATAGANGLFNCVNSGNASRYEYVSKIVELAGMAVEVRPSRAAIFQRRANVSNNEMADNWKMASIGLPAMPSWEDGLARYIEKQLLQCLESAK